MECWRSHPCKIAVKCLQNVSHSVAFRRAVVAANLENHELLESLYGSSAAVEAYNLAEQRPRAALELLRFLLRRPVTAETRRGGVDAITCATKMAIPVASVAELMYENCVDVMFDGVPFEECPELVVEVLAALVAQDGRFKEYLRFAHAREGELRATEEWREAVAGLI